MASLSAHTGSDADSGSRSQPPQAECTSSCSEGRLAKPKRCAMERAARPQPHVCHKAKENQRRPTCYDFQSFSLLSEGSLSWLLKHWLLSWLLKHCPREGNGSKNKKNKMQGGHKLISMNLDMTFPASTPVTGVAGGMMLSDRPHLPTYDPSS